MSILQKFRALPPLTRASIGGAFLAWGTLGLYLSETAEKKLGFSPSQSDQEALDGMVPRVVVVDREETSAMTGTGGNKIGGGEKMVDGRRD